MNQPAPAMKTGITPAMLKNFDQLVQHLLGIIQNRFGFEQAILFMANSEKRQLELVQSKRQLTISFDGKENLLLGAFTTGDILFENSAQHIFGEKSGFKKGGDSTFVLLPLVLAGQSVGVFVLVTEQKDFTEQEKTFLYSFGSRVALPLVTSWEVSRSQVLSEELQSLNNDYRGLIEVKRRFLEQVQELLSSALQRDSLSEQERVELFCTLSYLQSVLILSKRTIKGES